MSVEALTWVLNPENQIGKDHAEFAVLIVMANEVGKDLRGCHMAQQTIAERARMSRATAKRAIDRLTQRGILTPGDQTIVEYLPADKRPVVWDFAAGHVAGCAGNHRLHQACPGATGQIDPPVKKRRSATVQSAPPVPDRGVNLHPRHEPAGQPGVNLHPGGERGVRLTPNPSLRSSVGRDVNPSFPPGVQEDGGTDGDPAIEQASAFLADLPMPWTPSRTMVRELAPVMAERLAAGWTPSGAREWLTDNPGGVKFGHERVLRARVLEKMPLKPPSSTHSASQVPTVPVPPWCGKCDPHGEHNPSARWVDLPDGRSGRCLDCHPHAQMTGATA